MIDDNLEKLISQLPASPTVLDKTNVKKIFLFQQIIKSGGQIYRVLAVILQVS